VSASQLPIGSLIFLFAKEVGTGLLLGFSCRILFFALELAGAIVATEMGLMLSSTFNPLSATNVTAPGMIFFWMAGMILLSLDLHHWMLAGFQSSFKLVPIGGFQLSEGLAIEVLEKTTRMFRIAVQLTAPIMAVSFVVTLIFALLSRAVPQMNVFSENFPARTLAGLVVFGLTFSLTGQHLVNFLRRLPEDFQRMASLMGGG
jgi:flagellar biosynthesis protein FliR